MIPTLLKRTALVLFVLWSLLTSYFFISRLPEMNRYSYRDYSKDLKSLPVWRKDYCADWNARSFIDRFQRSVDTDIISLIRIQNRFYENNDCPGLESGTPDQAVVEKFAALYEKWPDLIKDFAEQHVVGIGILKGLPSSALIIDTFSNQQFYIAVNERIFDLQPNQWASEREASAIKPDKSSGKVICIIEEKNFDLKERTLENLLLHELAHGFGSWMGHTPNLYPDIWESRNLYEFYQADFDFSYTAMKSKNGLFEHFEKLHYYARNERKINFNEYINLLEIYQASNLPTMYSSQNTVELYADALYLYVHTMIQKRPFRYEIYKDDLFQREVPNNYDNGKASHFVSFFNKYLKNSIAKSR